ncbi:NAD-P-binding protein [Basidiobolus meristosporus CBS 931.73]|uniref:NAD-P-binding protein n=1 Tax=Basidiobolus meristosporus CBS 931.73 TaxID=1314790 RepID=A0A1Y1YTJ1_9FUNG|nr:NAD-P-binding protein [Basidiobolus meristosporus CBS 931.73]|eukprot:ORY01134.1 NAD-P-binding protein [Basidiobolus meristosporus CBS 931.73]
MSQYIVTGASRGLGLEFVRQILGKPGTKVFACCRNPQAATRLEELRRQAGKRLSIHQLDVTSEISIQRSVQEISKLADNGVDILINNAGIMGVAEGLTNVSKTELEELFTTNVTGPVLLVQSFLALLRQGQKPKIINISSGYGSLELNSNVPSSMAICLLATACFSEELKKEGIAVLSLDPGWVQTDMGGANASLTPHESISGMLQVIDSLTLASSGRFISYNGRQLPW